MRRLIFPVIGLAIGLFVFSIPSFSQEVIYPKAEIFGGFSMYRAGSTFMGWQASANFNVAHHLAIVGDFGGQYKTVLSVPLNSYQFLFGPRVMWRRNRVTPFVHAMFGGVKEGVGSATLTVLGTTLTTPAVSSTGLGMGMGGGFDINVSDRLALRVPQFDWTPMHIGGVWEKNVIRIGIGLVLKAGQE